MSKSPESNADDSADRLTTVLNAVTEALLRGTADPFIPLFSDDIVWDGLHSWQHCQGKETVLGFFNRGFFSEPRRIDHLDAHQEGDSVVLKATGPDFYEVTREGERIPRESRGLTFTFTGDQVTYLKGG